MPAHKKYTDEVLRALVLQYPTRKELNKNNRRAYCSMQSNGLLEHYYPIADRRPKGYWSYDKIKSFMSQYECASGLASTKEGLSCETAARKMGVYKDLQQELNYKVYGKEYSSLYKRLVYLLTSESNPREVYIGITCNLARRCAEHKKSGKFDGRFTAKALTESLPAKEAAEKEKILINQYRGDGYHIVVNKHDGGALGKSDSKYNESDYLKAIEACDTLLEFAKNYSGLCDWGRRQGIHLESTSELRRVSDNAPTLSECRRKAKICRNREDLRVNHRRFYDASLKKYRGMLDEVLPVKTRSKAA